MWLYMWGFESFIYFHLQYIPKNHFVALQENLGPIKIVFSFSDSGKLFLVSI